MHLTEEAATDVKPGISQIDYEVPGPGNFAVIFRPDVVD